MMPASAAPRASLVRVHDEAARRRRLLLQREEEEIDGETPLCWLAFYTKSVARIARAPPKEDPRGINDSAYYLVLIKRLVLITFISLTDYFLKASS